MFPAGTHRVRCCQCSPRSSALLYLLASHLLACSPHHRHVSPCAMQPCAAVVCLLTLPWVACVWELGPDSVLWGMQDVYLQALLCALPLREA